MLLDYGMKQIKDLSLSAHKKLQEELDKTLFLPNYIEGLIERAQDFSNKEFQGANTLYDKPYPRTIRIAPSVQEMHTAIKRISLDLERVKRSDMSAQEKYDTRQGMIRDAVKPKKVITVKERPLLWWGDVLKGINMRPGFINNDPTKCFPFVLGGTKSHVGAVGDTGEGKSVLMNAIIVSWLFEFPPWELNLTMNDGKKQEYGIYAQMFQCPQIRNIAITESSAYLASVMNYFDAEMKLMNDLFQKIGVKGLRALRDYLDLYIPANVMVHDEFAQAKALANAREIASMDESLQSIAKLGRVTRYHLFPTSQELRGHLEGSVLNQFTIGISVGTNEDNSKHMLGNGGALALKSKRGYAIVNDDRVTGAITNNKEYKVAFYPDDTDEQRMVFQMLLKRVCDTGTELGIKGTTTVFNEGDQKVYSQYENFIKECNKQDINTPRIPGEKTLVNIALGDGTEYTGKADTNEYFRWDYERKGNILIHAQSIDFIKYLCKLVGDCLTIQNINAKHMMIVDNMELFQQDYVPNYHRDITGEFNLEGYLEGVLARQNIIKYMLMREEDSLDVNFEDYMEKVRYPAVKFPDMAKLMSLLGDVANFNDNRFDEFNDWLVDPELIKDSNKELSDFIKIKGDVCRDFLNEYLYYDAYFKCRKGKYVHADDLPVTILWFFDPKNNVSINSRAGIKESFSTLLEVGPSVGVFSIIALSDTKDMKPIYSNCKHELISQPVSNFETNPWVNFQDKTGILCKYLICDGDGSKDKYFKQFMIL